MSKDKSNENAQHKRMKIFSSLKKNEEHKNNVSPVKEIKDYDPNNTDNSKTNNVNSIEVNNRVQPTEHGENTEKGNHESTPEKRSTEHKTEIASNSNDTPSNQIPTTTHKSDNDRYKDTAKSSSTAEKNKKENSDNKISEGLKKAAQISHFAKEEAEATAQDAVSAYSEIVKAQQSQDNYGSAATAAVTGVISAALEADAARHERSAKRIEEEQKREANKLLKEQIKKSQAIKRLLAKEEAKKDLYPQKEVEQYSSSLQEELHGEYGSAPDHITKENLYSSFESTGYKTPFTYPEQYKAPESPVTKAKSEKTFAEKEQEAERAQKKAEELQKRLKVEQIQKERQRRAETAKKQQFKSSFNDDKNISEREKAAQEYCKAEEHKAEARSEQTENLSKEERLRLKAHETQKRLQGGKEYNKYKENESDIELRNEKIIRDHQADFSKRMKKDYAKRSDLHKTEKAKSLTESTKQAEKAAQSASNAEKAAETGGEAITAGETAVEAAEGSTGIGMALVVAKELKRRHDEEKAERERALKEKIQRVEEFAADLGSGENLGDGAGNVIKREEDRIREEITDVPLVLMDELSPANAGIRLKRDAELFTANNRKMLTGAGGLSPSAFKLTDKFLGVKDAKTIKKRYRRDQKDRIREIKTRQQKIEDFIQNKSKPAFYERETNAAEIIRSLKDLKDLGGKAARGFVAGSAGMLLLLVIVVMSFNILSVPIILFSWMNPHKANLFTAKDDGTFAYEDVDLEGEKEVLKGYIAEIDDIFEEKQLAILEVVDKNFGGFDPDDYNYDKTTDNEINHYVEYEARIVYGGDDCGRYITRTGANIVNALKEPADSRFNGSFDMLIGKTEYFETDPVTGFRRHTSSKTTDKKITPIGTYSKNGYNGSGHYDAIQKYVMQNAGSKAPDGLGLRHLLTLFTGAPPAASDYIYLPFPDDIIEKGGELSEEQAFWVARRIDLSRVNSYGTTLFGIGPGLYAYMVAMGKVDKIEYSGGHGHGPYTETIKYYYNKSPYPTTVTIVPKNKTEYLFYGNDIWELYQFGNKWIRFGNDFDYEYIIAIAAAKKFQQLENDDTIDFDTFIYNLTRADFEEVIQDMYSFSPQFMPGHVCPSSNCCVKYDADNNPSYYHDGMGHTILRGQVVNFSDFAMGQASYDYIRNKTLDMTLDTFEQDKEICDAYVEYIRNALSEDGSPSHTVIPDWENDEIAMDRLIVKYENKTGNQYAHWLVEENVADAAYYRQMREDRKERLKEYYRKQNEESTQSELNT